MAKKKVVLTEGMLRDIIRETIEEVIAENADEGLGDFFDKFRRTDRAQNGAPNQQFLYSPQKNSFTYFDERGGEHDTGIGYDKGKIGRNWNPFKSNGRNTNVTPHDAAMMRGKLSGWQNNNAQGITNSYKHNDEYENWRSQYYNQQNADRQKNDQELQRLSQPSGYKDPIRNYMGSNPLR